MKRIFLLVLIALAATATPTVLPLRGAAVPVQAQKATPSDDEVNAIARQLYCPVCENIPLDVCPTQACAQWRALIREKLAEGWTEEQIKQYFVEQYGARVLAEPPRQGWTWLLYVLPAIFIAAGAYLLFRLFRREPGPALAGAAPPGGAAGPTQGADEYLSRFEEEAGKEK
jgi:cytochrome c-type biogenesis protein CcmH